MATSGSKNFELDVAEYVEEAYERCGIEARTGYDLRSARRSLNLLFADWANRGLNRWTIQQQELPLASNVADYPLGILIMVVASSSGLLIGETITGGTSGATAKITNEPTSGSGDLESNTLAITVPNGTFTAGETITGSTSSVSLLLLALLLI